MDVFFDWRREEKTAVAEMVLNFAVALIGLMCLMVVWLSYPENIMLRYSIAVAVLIITSAVFYLKNMRYSFVWLTLLVMATAWKIIEAVFGSASLIFVTVAAVAIILASTWYYTRKLTERL